jgi:hypothetical protein
MANNPQGTNIVEILNEVQKLQANKNLALKNALD